MAVATVAAMVVAVRAAVRVVRAVRAAAVGARAGLVFEEARAALWGELVAGRWEAT